MNRNTYLTNLKEIEFLLKYLLGDVLFVKNIISFFFQNVFDIGF